MQQKPISVVFIILVAIFLSGCNNKEPNRLPFYNDPDVTPVWFDRDDDAEKDIHRISPFSFVNQDGDTVTEKTFEGKIYVADFFFTTCPGICPTMTGNMKIIQEKFRDDDDVLILSHSVTPERDSVAVLHEYARTHGVVSGRWHLVTGSRETIYTLARQSYFADEDLGVPVSENDFLHTERFILVDKKRKIRGIYKGTFRTEVKQLIEDIYALKSE